jgi:DNA repair protein RadC
VKRLAAGDRPREKLDRVGVAGLGDNELVAVVLGQGGRGASVLDLASAVLDRAGGTAGLSRVSLDDLRQVRGVGLARAAQVIAAVELGRRTVAAAGHPRRFRQPREMAQWLLPQFGGRPVEQFGVVLLDTSHGLLGTRVVSTGSLDASSAHPREVFRDAVVGRAAAVVLFHNHPSGDPSPSREDVSVTRRLVAAATVLGIEILDHVILGAGTYFSFRESARM